MKTVQTLFPSSHQRASAGWRGGVTFPELLVTITLFLLLAAAIIYAHLFGLRMSKFTETKLKASNSARDALGKVTEEIQNCGVGTWVGTISNGDFVALLDGVPQTGSALLISNSADYIVYFVNPSDQSFRRTTSVAGTTTVIARTVTNAAVFSAQDFQGNPLTNSQRNHVIHLTLEFFQPQLALPAADYYKLETSVTRRAMD
jgi:hypothetical protein